MLSACAGSFNSRYSSAFLRALGTASRCIGFSSNMRPSSETTSSVLSPGVEWTAYTLGTALFSSDGPQEIACQHGAAKCSAIAEHENHLVQMFDLEAIVQGITKPVCPMAQAQKA